MKPAVDWCAGGPGIPQTGSAMAHAQLPGISRLRGAAGGHRGAILDTAGDLRLASNASGAGLSWAVAGK